MPEVIFQATPAALEPSQARPWMQHWPAQALDTEDLSTGEVQGYQKGQKVILGGVAGSFDKVLYDTAAKKG
ncbi:unnamed protein product [Alternaria alternata]